MLEEKQQLLAQLAEIQGRLAELEAQQKQAAFQELEKIAESINTLVRDAKRKADAAGLYFEYAEGYETFGVYEWQQSSYC